MNLNNLNHQNIIKRAKQLFLGAIALGFISLVLIRIGVFGKLPPLSELDNPKFELASEIISSDNQLIGKYFLENRINLTYDEISPNVINCLLATEDIRFYKHSGIDLRGLSRALFFMGKKGGASTLTQQLAKMLFHKASRNPVKRILQKVKEWIIAAQLERRYTKEEIIAMYLNKAEFINNAYGLDSASKIYFNKSPDQLSIHQAAMLVGMLKGPYVYNPVNFPDRALKRRNLVLNQLNRYDFIEKDSCDSLKTLPLDLELTKEGHNYGTATYFREMLRLELKKLLDEQDPRTGKYEIQKANGEKYNLYTDGLKIYTTIDSRMQNMAETAVKSHVENKLQNDLLRDLKRHRNFPFSDEYTQEQVDDIFWQKITSSVRFRKMIKNDVQPKKQDVLSIFNKPINTEIYKNGKMTPVRISPLDSIKLSLCILHSGLMSMNPTTGHIKAWVGGINNTYFKYDHVLQSKRQVGSTFKVFLYTLAIQEGLNPCNEIPNISYTVPKNKWGLLEDWTPRYGPKFEGKVNFKFGLANSMNNVAAYLINQYGPVPVITLAQKMGITSDLDPVVSVCLGVSDVSLYEMTGAFSCFANKGTWTNPIFVTRIEDQFGNLLKEFVPKSQVSISEETADIMLEMLKGVTSGVYNEYMKETKGTGYYRIRSVYNFDNPIAAKTGTTQNNSDGWFIGMTPDLVTGVWVGADDPRVHFTTTTQGQGANTALPVWAKYMQQVYKSEELNISKDNFDINPEVSKNFYNCKQEEEEMMIDPTF